MVESVSLTKMISKLNSMPYVPHHSYTKQNLHFTSSMTKMDLLESSIVWLLIPHMDPWVRSSYEHDHSSLNQFFKLSDEHMIACSFESLKLHNNCVVSCPFQKFNPYANTPHHMDPKVQSIMISLAIPCSFKTSNLMESWPYNILKEV